MNTRRKQPSTSRRTSHIFVSPKLKEQIRLGHPWIYRNAVERAPVGLLSGAWVRVQSANQQAIGIWDESGPIAVRLFSHTRIPDAKWVRAKVEEAWQRRESIRAARPVTTAYRWIFGENDGLPGLVVDLYGDDRSQGYWAVVKTYASSLMRIRKWVMDALSAFIELRGIVDRSGEGWSMLAGSPPPQEMIIREHGHYFAVDVLRGQKTGFFLDQRDNRLTIAHWSRGKEVLNLFSYTGGFSVYAAQAGARQVVSIDSSAAAIATAKHNFHLNGLDTSGHEFIVADAFELLQRYYGQGRRFDLIIVDPPSFARARHQLSTASNAYRKLNALAMRCLRPGGVLATSSCTAQVSPQLFRTILADAAADARRRFIIQHEAGHPLDHPVAAHFPEGRYLKFLLGQVVERN